MIFQQNITLGVLKCTTNDSNLIGHLRVAFLLAKGK